MDAVANLVDQVRVDGGASGVGHGGIARRRMGGGSHGDEHDQQIDQDGHVREPGEALQGPDLAENEAGQCPHQTADGVAQPELGRLGQCLSVRDDDGADVTYQLDGLEDVDHVPAP